MHNGTGVNFRNKHKFYICITSILIVENHGNQVNIISELLSLMDYQKVIDKKHGQFIQVYIKIHHRNIYTIIFIRSSNKY